MTLWTRVNEMSPKSRRLAAGGLAIMAVLGGLWAVRAVLDAGDPARAPARSGETAGMQGMDMGAMPMGGDGSVRLSAGQIRTFGVTFGTVELRPLTDQVRTVGIVSFDETRLAGVAPKFGGYIERLYVDFTGQPVRRGQPLVEIYSPELVAAQEELLLAARLDADPAQSRVAGVPGASSSLTDAARRRLRLWDIGDARIDTILASGRARRTMTLYAPVSGVVIEKRILAGEAVAAGQMLYTIADLSEVWVEAELREADAGLIAVGSAATVELAAFPGQPVRGRVEYVQPTLNGQARTLEARIALRNPDGRLKPGMFATVRLDAAGRSALTVPASAVLNTGERTLVFVDMGDGRILPHDVEIGRTAGGFAEVLSGLEPGQRVVTSAQYLLDSESNLAEVMKSMLGMGNTSDMGSMDMDGMDMSAPAVRMDAPEASGQRGTPPRRER